jgi:SPP1 gp7 family putative phage head morphogenesis protein
LRRVARAIADIVRGLFPTGTEAVDFDAARRIEEALEGYSSLIGPWAESVGRRMLEEVSRRDAGVWSELGRELGIGLRREIESAPTGALFQEALAQQVHLIQSVPLEAATRIHSLATEALMTGRRAKEIAEEIMNTGQVSRSRADTIARTETSRAASTLQAIRAQHVGSPGFIWRSAGDRDVRPLHRRYNGQFYYWNNPPLLDDGRPGLPGTIWNCRCMGEPVLSDLFTSKNAA